MGGLTVARRGNLYYLTSPKNADRLKPPTVTLPMPGGAAPVRPGEAKP
jgi:hypothetical protein